MKTVVPDYYPLFKCIADKCNHSCCVDWEIDIDPLSYQRYQNMTGEWGERIRKQIVCGNGIASFQLTSEKRCPFLQANGLCSMILELGEESLCQICTDHPRFRNFYTNRTEIGLGLCCEEACRLVLTRKEPVHLVTLAGKDDKNEIPAQETANIKWRNRMLQLVTDRRYSLNRRIELLGFFEKINLKSLFSKNWIHFFLKLERLDEEWTVRLENTVWLEEFSQIDENWETPFEQLLHYLMFRHLSVAELSHAERKGKTAFALLALHLIHCIILCAHSSGIDELIEIVRLFSCEIEYSDLNRQMIVNEIQRMM